MSLGVLMEGKNANDLQRHPNYDKGLFTDGLKDLRNVKEQLYSAAEHFEASYIKNDQKQMLLESLKDYISKSLIKTIDHLGSVMYKLNNFLDHSLNQFSTTKFQVLCIEQRLQTCQAYAKNVGISQLSLTTQTPKYPKKYILQEGSVSERKPESSAVRNGYCEQVSSQFSQDLDDFSFTKAVLNKRLEKRSRSISPLQFRIKRIESPSRVHRSISPNISRRSSLYPQRGKPKNIEVHSKNTKNLFKVLLSMYKSKNKA